MESRTLCQWCASAAGDIVRTIISTSKKIGEVLGNLCRRGPSRLPKIEVEEPEPVGEASSAPVQQVQKPRKTTFRYYNPEAKEVKLVGDFTDWETIPMNEDSRGDWRATVELIPGKYTYKFVLDGEWIKDPKNPETQSNGYGAESSIIEVEKQKKKQKKA